MTTIEDAQKKYTDARNAYHAQKTVVNLQALMAAYYELLKAKAETNGKIFQNTKES